MYQLLDVGEFACRGYYRRRNDFRIFDMTVKLGSTTLPLYNLLDVVVRKRTIPFHAEQSLGRRYCQSFFVSPLDGGAALSAAAGTSHRVRSAFPGRVRDGLLQW